MAEVSKSVSDLFDPQRLELARKLRGLRKNQLAEQVSVSPAAITQYETGRSRDPSLPVLLSAGRRFWSSAGLNCGFLVPERFFGGGAVRPPGTDSVSSSELIASSASHGYRPRTRSTVSLRSCSLSMATGLAEMSRRELAP